MRCRVCNSPETYVLGSTDTIWHRCLYCGSDTSEYDSVLYDHVPRRDVDLETAVQGFFYSTTLLDKVHSASQNKRCLDIGCYDGAGVEALIRRRWNAEGFDVNPHATARGRPVTIAERFVAELYGVESFGAVMSCEVLEHVHDWCWHLIEIHKVLIPGGHAVVQTPRPTTSLKDIWYCYGHLQLFSPLALSSQFTSLNFAVCESTLWKGGQAWLIRK